jgi:hypothetical protein
MAIWNSSLHVPPIPSLLKAPWWPRPSGIFIFWKDLDERSALCVQLAKRPDPAHLRLLMSENPDVNSSMENEITLKKLKYPLQNLRSIFWHSISHNTFHRIDFVGVWLFDEDVLTFGPSPLMESNLCIIAPDPQFVDHQFEELAVEFLSRVISETSEMLSVELDPNSLTRLNSIPANDYRDSDCSISWQGSGSWCGQLS